MGKIRNIYRAFNAATLKAKADIPSAANITVNASDIDCTVISLLAVKNLLGASTYSLHDLCTHVNVNIWSNFGPATVDYTDNLVTGTGIITSSLPTTAYSLGSFAGYNHGAYAPGWPTGELASLQAARLIQPYGNAVFAPSITIGEIEYPSMSHVAMSLWTGGVCFNAELLALSGLQETATFNLTDTSIYGDTAVVVKFRIIAGSPSTVDYIDNPTLYDRYYIPNITDVNSSVKMEIATAIVYTYTHAPAGNDHHFDTIGFSVGDGGYLSWSDAYWDADFANGLTVTAILYQRNYTTDTWTAVGSPSQIYTIGYYFGSFPTGAQTSGELWSGNTVTAYGYLYELVIDANT